MPQNTPYAILLVNLLAVAAMMVILVALHRWQRTIWRRERGEQQRRGFAVEPPANRDK